jgi:hypothetical protein
MKRIYQSEGQHSTKEMEEILMDGNRLCFMQFTSGIILEQSASFRGQDVSKPALQIQNISATEKINWCPKVEISPR